MDLPKMTVIILLQLRTLCQPDHLLGARTACEDNRSTKSVRRNGRFVATAGDVVSFLAADDLLEPGALMDIGRAWQRTQRGFSVLTFLPWRPGSPMRKFRFGRAKLLHRGGSGAGALPPVERSGR